MTRPAGSPIRLVFDAASTPAHNVALAVAPEAQAAAGAYRAWCEGRGGGWAVLRAVWGTYAAGMRNAWALRMGGPR